ncbi:MAG: hypothetical protein QGH15_04535 [Kiritimatiellia bacterium]|jgi:hypothetical protein|nr:hypothetical protein [Kiritimatiellia bacterium]
MELKRTVLLPALYPLMATLLTLSGFAVADSGTWTNDASGSWSNLNSWSGGIIADGPGNTADFSTIDISTELTVAVDTARTIGNLTFGDTDASSAAGWTLTQTGTNDLTLASGGTITITNLAEGKNVDINVPLAADTKMDLRFNGIDVIGSLYLSGIEYGAGTYGADASRPAYFSGPGKLRIAGRAGQLLIIR